MTGINEQEVIDLAHDVNERVDRIIADNERLIAELLAATTTVKTMNAISLHQTDRMFPERAPLNHFHPLTCGNDSNHTPLFPYWNGTNVELICRDCDYTQQHIPPIPGIARL